MARVQRSGGQDRGKRSHVTPKQIGRIVQGGLLAVALLSGCTTPPPAVPTAAVAATAKVMATVTLTATPSLAHTATPAPTRTALPTETPTHMSTLVPATPDAPASAYRLRSWELSDSAHRIALIRSYVDWYADYQPGYHGGLANSAAGDLAIVELESLTLHPNQAGHEDLAWSAAQHLAMSGNRFASTLLAALIEQALNAKAVTLETLGTWPRLAEPWIFGDVVVTPAPNLYGDGRSAEILAVGTLQGAVLSIVEDGGRYVVRPVMSFWQVESEAGFEVQVGDVDRDGSPEVAASYALQMGSGPTFAYTVVHVLKWTSGQWVDLTGDGFLVGGHTSSWNLDAEETSEANATLVISTAGEDDTWPYCAWALDYRYMFQAGRYVLQRTDLKAPQTFDKPTEMLCLRNGLDWAVTYGEYARLLPIMRDAVRRWPTAEDLAPYGNDPYIGSFDASEQRFFLFQLARFEALAGEVEAARQHFEQVLADASALKDDRAQELAQRYADGLNDPAAVERASAGAFRRGEGLPREYALMADLVPLALTDTERGEQSLFGDRDPVTALALFQKATANCLAGESGVPLYCTESVYLQALSAEWAGQSDLAIKDYWQLWHEAPASLAGVMARLKLERKP